MWLDYKPFNFFCYIISYNSFPSHRKVKVDTHLYISDGGRCNFLRFWCGDNKLVSAIVSQEEPELNMNNTNKTIFLPISTEK